MASRNGNDPTDRRRTEIRRPSMEIALEDQVAQETEEVFQSYAFYRYQQEREQTEGDVPHDPEIAAIPHEPNSTNCQVGRRLATIGDDINARYDKEFSEMLKSLQPTKDNAYEYFIRIASSLFESGINWGRVIALLGFGYRMAIHVYQHGMTGFLRRIARYMADFVLRNRIARWIAQQGGWVGGPESQISVLCAGLPPLPPQILLISFDHEEYEETQPLNRCGGKMISFTLWNSWYLIMLDSVQCFTLF
uniref:Bcl-2 homologous antagonist/killer n=1 Tax=Anolis carolinensis TaxID=28377 RepID=A0A803TLD5_ANOCA